MKSYLSLIPISAKVRRRQNRMTLMCIVIAVFLVTTVFSMVGAIIDMEKTNVISNHGYWHISLQNVSEDIAAQISARSDVKTVSRCVTINQNADGAYYIGDQKAALYGVDESWITDIWDCLEEGTYPQSDTEIMITMNAKNTLGVNIGDRITLTTPSGNMEYTISGFGSHDAEFNKIYDAFTVYMNRTALSEICSINGIEESPVYYVRFSSDRGTTKRINEIKRDYGLVDEAVDENTALLAITGYSSNGYARALYPLAAIVFVLIVLAGVFMISSSMNSNVAQRTQFFGMMRCIGMSKQQVIRYVRLEALNWCKTAIPIGVALGIVTTWGLCFWLKYGIQGELTEIPLFYVSISGIVLGIVVGILTVLLAAHSPAKRAAKVSPATVVSGNAQNTAKSCRMRLGSFFKIEVALGMNHAISARKNLILMTGSFALSIILFFGFSAGLDFAKILMPSTRSWAPDFTITSDDETNSVDKNLAVQLRKIDGIDTVYGNMAAIDVPAVTDKDVSKITLVSYEEYMLQCAGENKVSGDVSKLSGDSDYVLTIYDARNPLEVGDKVQVNGSELEIAGIVSEGLFEDDITLICTEETFERLIGGSGYALLNVKIANNADKDRIAASIRNIMGEANSLADYCDTNKENKAEFWAFRFVVYAFLAIIVLMAALNIINSTSMSVSARTKQYGAMRAVGMDGRQLTRMIVAEVFTYAISGCIIGCILGLLLNKMIFEAFITPYFGEIWHIPVAEIILILLIIFASSAAAIHAPAKRMRNMAITATINEL
ncbi:ABC transporter permease [Kineothrix sp. MSJ-39]|uniref:ABC transporter permease n=1 Tax=Kineothrix sp. MSJ-39 TaxID=2841533 RepID=UPI001C11F2FF|nr:ABC transporter permease [Kineothrix sp. MSJ-39]MBU5428655.1 ABC transporter permease [Kineothrix sp. MSJ-39]